MWPKYQHIVFSAVKLESSQEEQVSCTLFPVAPLNAGVGMTIADHAHHGSWRVKFSHWGPVVDRNAQALDRTAATNTCNAGPRLRW